MVKTYDLLDLTELLQLMAEGLKQATAVVGVPCKAAEAAMPGHCMSKSVMSQEKLGMVEVMHTR